MTVQTTVDARPAAGVPGQIYDGGEFHDIQRYIASEDIPFGALVRIVGDYCERPDNAGEVTGVMAGIAVKSDEVPTQTGWKAGDIVPVMTVGRIWVLSETAQADQSTPFFRTAGAGTQGAARNDADGGNATQRPGFTVYRASTGTAAVVLNLAIVA